MSRDPFPTEPQPIRDSEERNPASTRRADSAEKIPTDVGEIGDRGSEIQHPAPRGKDHRPEAVDSPRAYYFRDRTYFLRDSELTTLAEIGTFRLVDAEDFAEFSYAGDADRMNREIRRLAQQGLVAQKPLNDERSGAKTSPRPDEERKEPRHEVGPIGGGPSNLPRPRQATRSQA